MAVGDEDHPPSVVVMIYYFGGNWSRDVARLGNVAQRKEPFSVLFTFAEFLGNARKTDWLVAVVGNHSRPPASLWQNVGTKRPRKVQTKAIKTLQVKL